MPGTTPPRRLRGLYLITAPAASDEARWLAGVAAALRGGASIVQYRDKEADPPARTRRAQALRRLCAAHGVALIVNDDVELARAVGAGVHLGRDDTPLAAARARLGPGRLIGISCYDSLERARAAAAGGADYVAFGRFFPSHTKPEATPAPLELLPRARAALSLPIVAIGGITPENGAALIAAGADLLAVGHAVSAADDPQTAAQRIAALFGPG